MGQVRHSVRAAVVVHVVIVVVSLSVGWAGAAVPVIYNTAVDSNGAVLPNNSIDPHYAVTPSNIASVDSGVSATPAANTSSAWIRPNSDFGPGTYSFETLFDWPADETITIEGQWAARASGLNIVLNGVASGQTTPVPGNADWTAFTVTGQAVANGNNALVFQTYRDFGETELTALRVEIFSVTPVPEPASAAAAILSLTSAAGLHRRRR